MTDWGELVATALIGTDRRPFAAGGDPAVALLDEAAAWVVYRRAGTLATPGLAAPVAAPPEAGAPVVPAAAARLAALLDPWSTVDSMTRTALVPEWLVAAARSGRVVAPELLPELLEAGRRDPALRPHIAAAGGARAAWLAALRPEWSWLAGAPAPVGDADWHEGSPAQRAGYLAELRGSDPDAARDLLAADWPALPPEERVRLLATLASGLGTGDEPFLESTLDDRRREVRAAAQNLLAALPGSAYRARALSRARAALRVRGGVLEVRPPAECDRAMRRDGIEPRPPAGLGERAWWLEQILARTPLADLGAVAPASFVQLSIVDDWEFVVLGGLAQAAAAQSDPAWAPPLLDRLEARLRAEGRRWFAVLEGLYAALPPDDLVRRIAARLADPHPDATRLVEWLLQRVPAPWPDALAGPVLRWVEQAARADRPGPSLEPIARLAALRLPVAYAGSAGQVAQRLHADRPDSPRTAVFARLAATLQLRQEMIEELA